MRQRSRSDEVLDILAGDGIASVQVGMTHQDPMETFGNSAAAVGGGVNDVTGPVIGPAGDVTGEAATTVGDGAGSAGKYLAGENPMEKAPLVGGTLASQLWQYRSIGCIHACQEGCRRRDCAYSK